MSDFYDKQGRPIDLWEWSHLMEDREYRVVAYTVVGGVLVSTVWLGIDHSWGMGPPIIFETMVFDYLGGKHDMEMDRYHTEVQALAGHDQMVARVRGTTRAVLEDDQPSS